MVHRGRYRANPALHRHGHRAQGPLPRVSTILETLRIRFGPAIRIILFVNGVSVQILVTASLLLGASAAFSVTTGDNTVAMNYLTQLVVVIYKYRGGVNSRCLSDYVHTLVIFILVLVAMFKVMAILSRPVLGSLGALWDLSAAAGEAADRGLRRKGRVVPHRAFGSRRHAGRRHLGRRLQRSIRRPMIRAESHNMRA